MAVKFNEILEGIELSDISSKKKNFSDEINDNWELV